MPCAFTPATPATLTLLDTGAKVAATVAAARRHAGPADRFGGHHARPARRGAPGEPVAAAIIAGTLDGYEVPRDAVLNDEQGDYVFQLDAHDVAHSAWRRM